MSSKPKYVIYVPPYEWGLVEPLSAISEYIKRKLGERVYKVSDYHIARMFPVLEEFMQGRETKASAIVRILRIFARHYGFESEEEKERVNVAVAKLIDRIATIKVREPVKVFKLVRSLRELLIGLVRDLIVLPISVYEKQSEKTERSEKEG